MSDLSFLIENQNEVEIDQSFLLKCQESNTTESKVSPGSLTKIVSSRELKLNRNKNLISTKKKAGSPRSFNMTQHEEGEGEAISKLNMRIEALEDNQKRMEKQIGVEFFKLKDEIQKRNQ